MLINGLISQSRFVSLCDEMLCQSNVRPAEVRRLDNLKVFWNNHEKTVQETEMEISYHPTSNQRRCTSTELSCVDKANQFWPIRALYSENSRIILIFISVASSCKISCTSISTIIFTFCCSEAGNGEHCSSHLSEDQIHDRLRSLNTHKSLGPN